MFDLRGKVAIVTAGNGGIIAAFLSSAASDFVTGHGLRADGGFSIAV